MKNLFALFFLCTSFASAESFIAFRNQSSYPVTVDLCSVPPGGEILLPYYDSELCVGVRFWDKELANVLAESICYFNQPLVIADNSFNVISHGKWPIESFTDGFGLGLAVAGCMLVLFIIQLLRKPVIES